MAYMKIEEINDFCFKKVGRNVRISKNAMIYNPELMEIGDNSRIDDFCVISGKVTLGRNVHIAPHCLVAGGVEGCVLEDFSGLAYYVQVFSQSDDYSGATLTNPTVPYEYKNEKKSAVNIGRHVIVGAGSVILPGVNVAEGCSVGAMSLVLKSTDSWGIYIGNPAKRLKDRKKDLLLLERSYIEKHG